MILQSFILFIIIYLMQYQLQNGGFEAPMGKEWSITFSPFVSIVRDSTAAFSGKYSLKIESSFPMENVFYGGDQTVSVKSGEDWMELAIRIKCNDLKGTAGVDIHFLDPPGTRLPEYKAQVILDADNYPKVWEYYDIKSRIPAGTSRIRVALFLKGKGKAWFDDLSLTFRGTAPELDINPSSGAYLLKKSDINIWFEFAEQKVFFATPLSTTLRSAIEIQGAGNEWEPFQIVFNPRRAVNNCSVTFTDLKDEKGNKIGSKQIACYSVGYVTVKQASSAEGVIGSNPDYLIPAGQFDLKAQINNPIWITIRIPADAKPGIYKGRIRFVAEGREYAQIPIILKVWDFILPEKNHLDVISNVWWPMIQKYDRRSLDVIRGDYIANLREHRISIFNAGEIESVIKDGHLSVSQVGFDRMVKDPVAKLGFSSVTVGPFLGNADGWRSRRNWLGWDPAAPQFEKYLTSYAAELERAAAVAGLTGSCWLYYWDEPPRNDPDLDRIVRLGRIIKKAAPKLKIFLTTWPASRWFGLVDIWCLPFSREYFNLKTIRERQSAGEKIFVYNNDPWIDTPLIDKRMYAWRYRQAGVDGVYAWWSLNYWPDDPYEKTSQALFADNRSSALKAGDGVLLYPNANGSGPPVNSLRWEIFRQGLEDYEYLALLAEAIDRTAAQLAPSETFKNFSEYRIRQLLDAVVRDYFSDWSRDVPVLYELRRRLGEEIAATNRAPKVLIKIYDPAKSGASGRTLIGLAEKGSQVSINGVMVGVSENGVFGWEDSGKVDSLVVKISKGKSKKIFTVYLK